MGCIVLRLCIIVHERHKPSAVAYGTEHGRWYAYRLWSRSSAEERRSVAVAKKPKAPKTQIVNLPNVLPVIDNKRVAGTAGRRDRGRGSLTYNAQGPKTYSFTFFPFLLPLPSPRANPNQTNKASLDVRCGARLMRLSRYVSDFVCAGLASCATFCV